jgi:hypothetical protein
VLVSINPYKPLTLYTPEIIEIYKSRTFIELPPHVYVRRLFFLFGLKWSAARKLDQFHRPKIGTCRRVKAPKLTNRLSEFIRLLYWICCVKLKGHWLTVFYQLAGKAPKDGAKLKLLPLGVARQENGDPTARRSAV